MSKAIITSGHFGVSFIFGGGQIMWDMEAFRCFTIQRGLNYDGIMMELWQNNHRFRNSDTIALYCLAAYCHERVRQLSDRCRLYILVYTVSRATHSVWCKSCKKGFIVIYHEQDAVLITASIDCMRTSLNS